LAEHSGLVATGIFAVHQFVFQLRSLSLLALLTVMSFCPLGSVPVLSAGMVSSADESFQPRVYFAPNVMVEWVIGEKSSADVFIENVSGMRGICFELYWDGYYDPRLAKYSQVLSASAEDAIVYETLLPKPYKA
jgi:hypothetical protein